MKRIQEFLCVAIAMLLSAGIAAAQDTIDFEGLPEGTIVYEVYSAGGAGPVKVEASNEKFPPGQNAAIIFDSSCPPTGEPKDCSGEDQDLGTPNEAFGGPGQGNQGSGGEYANREALNNVLIVAEDLARNGDLVADPDDEGSLAVNQITLDFSEIGPITMHSIAVVDINFGDQQSTIDLLDASGQPLGESPYEIPRTENNGVIPRYLFLQGSDSNSSERVPVSGVSKMIVWLRGSGAIDNITFSPQIDIETLTNGNQADLVDDDDIPWIGIGEAVAWTYQVTNTSSMQLTDVVVTDSHGVEVNCPKETLEGGEQMICSGGGTSLDLTLADLGFQSVQGRCLSRDGRPLYENTGSVTAQGGGYTVSDTDPSHYCSEKITGIYVRKQRKGPDVRGLPNGSDATFKIVVWNPGTSALTNIKVSDLLAPDCDREFSRLGPGKSTSYDCTVAGLAMGGANVTDCSFVNEVVATGESEDGTLTDSDTSTIELMGLTIDKNFQNATADAAEFEITVTNNGCDLDSVRVTDEMAPDCERDLGALPAGESRNYTCSMPLENEACVEGMRGDGTVGACDTATFTVASGGVGGGGEGDEGSDGDDGDDGGTAGGDSGSGDSGSGSEASGDGGGGDGKGGSSGMLFLLLALLVAGGLFAWNRMKAG